MLAEELAEVEQEERNYARRRKPASDQHRDCQVAIPDLVHTDSIGY
jgi:hypothetical protein